MPKRTCSVEGCERPTKGRGWCSMHYERWRRNGDPLTLVVLGRGSGRSITPDGYVILLRPEHPLANTQGWVLEHRMVAYDAGLLTDLSLHVHHRDEHKTNNALGNLEMMTASAHSAHHGLGGSAAKNAAKTHCPQGHPYDEANTYRIPSRPTMRYCRACMAVHRATYEERKRQR